METKLVVSHKQTKMFPTPKKCSNSFLKKPQQLKSAYQVL